MKDHPLVKEVRKIRQKIAQEYNFSPKKIAQAIKKAEVANKKDINKAA